MTHEDPVTVVTVTRRRLEVLPRALQSVADQDYPARLRHLVVVDDCRATVEFLEQRAGSGGRLSFVSVPRTVDDQDGPSRLARLRNHALELVDSPWVAYLDDDNWFDPDHVRSLVETARRTGSPAVHSQRRLYHRDGRPFLEQRFPWTRDQAAGARLYADAVRRGILQVGSNVVRDRVDPHAGPNSARIVDMNSWLLRTELMRAIGFQETYDRRDWLYLVCEDNKLLRDLIARGVAIASSGAATLNYSLGGYSNNFDDCSHRWIDERAASFTAEELAAMSRFPPSWRERPTN